MMGTVDTSPPYLRSRRRLISVLARVQDRDKRNRLKLTVSRDGQGGGIPIFGPKVVVGKESNDDAVERGGEAGFTSSSD